MPFNDENKKTVKAALLSAVFTVLALLLVNFAFTHSWGLSSSTKQPFTVQGSSTVNAEPDQANVYFTVSKTNKSLTTAQNEANTFISTMVNDLIKIGIPKADIKTDNYNSYPNYAQQDKVIMPYPQQTQTIISYTVSQGITIKIHDIAKISAVIDTVTKDGAENISGPSFTFSEEKQKSLTNEARTQAIADAKQKAQAIAKAAGIHLGRITNVQEGSSPYPGPVMYDTKAIGLGGAESVPTQINPGQNSITQTITLYYDTW